MVAWRGKGEYGTKIPEGFALGVESEELGRQSTGHHRAAFTDRQASRVVFKS